MGHHLPFFFLLQVLLHLTENVQACAVKVVCLKPRQSSFMPSTHTGFFWWFRVKAPVSEQIQTLVQCSCAVRFRGRAQAPVACLELVSGLPCRLPTKRKGKASGQRFHATCSCTFLVAHWSTQPYFVTPTRLQYG